jgi:tRNA(Ile)-lysidine synthase
VRWEAFLDDLAAALERLQLLQAGAAWVLGVSGGPDSTLLLHAFSALSEKRGLGWKLHVGHLHHGLRDQEADADAEFVKQLAQQLDVPFHEERADIRAAVAGGAGSTEEVARNRRYDFLERIALTAGSDLVAVANHADDNAETVLHRICRGTGLRGLGGMREIRPIQPGSRVRLIRPMLSMRRASLMAAVEHQKLEYRLDHTNFLPDSNTRAKLRNVVLPTLARELNPNIHEALLRLGEQARWLGNYLEDAAARTFEALIVSEERGHISLNVKALLAKQKIIQAAVIRRAAQLVLGAETDLSFNNVDAVLRLAAENVSGKELHLPGPVVVRKVYERLEFRPKSEAEETPPAEMLPIVFQPPGVIALPPFNATLSAEVCELDADKIGERRAAANPYEEWLDFERVQPPLYIRSRREGDRFWPLGAPGSKSISDFLSDEKIDPVLRSRTGVLCDQAGPIWVMPLRIDERVKLRATSRRALRLLLRPGESNGPAGGA